MRTFIKTASERKFLAVQSYLGIIIDITGEIMFLKHADGKCIRRSGWFLLAAAITLACQLQAANVKLGPYVQFTESYSAVVRWETSVARNSIVEYGLTSALGSRILDSAKKTVHEISINDLQWKKHYYYRVGFTDGSGETFTETYGPGALNAKGPLTGIDNSMNFSVRDCSNTASPYATDAMTPIYQAAADRIINETGIKKGYCLVLGSGQGRLAFELAKRSELIIIGVDDDTNRIDTAASKLMKAGLYGSRIKLRKVTSLSNLPFTKYFANLVVSERMISDGHCPGTAAEMFRLLRPTGGTAYLGQPAGCSKVLKKSEIEKWLNAGSVTHRTTSNSKGIWSKAVRPELAGSGWWSHQYADPANSANSNDTLAGATKPSDLQTQWVGRPGADFGVDRHVRMPAPLAKNGRLYHQGLNRIVAMDSYNGAILWSMEIPHLRRVNIGRDGSNLCADDDHLFVAVRDKCWRLDGDSSDRSVTFSVAPDRNWGCSFRYGDKLYGTAAKRPSSYTNIWENDELTNTSWYDFVNREQSSKVCSDNIFAFNKDDSSNPVWTYDKGIIINTSICIADNRVYFTECRTPAVKAASTGRFYDELWDDLWLVALDANSGKVIWEKSIKPGAGLAVFNLVHASGTLILESSGISPNNYYLYAYNVADGNLKWEDSFGWSGDHGPHTQRPVVRGDYFYVAGNRYNINDGSRIDGGPSGTCGIVSGSQNMFFYRNWDKLCAWSPVTNDSGTWAHFRPSCWLNTIAAGNMLLAPEGGGGCTCPESYLNTSVGWVRSGK